MPPAKSTPAAAKSAAKLRSIAEWDALLARYPPGSRSDLVRTVAFTLASNVVLWQFLQSGRMRPTHLVLLVALEAVFLTAFAWAQGRFVPPEALMEEKQPLRARLFTLLFGLVWLGFVYAIFLGAFVNDRAALGELARDPWQAILAAGLLWPFCLTMTAAVADSVRDWIHWRHSTQLSQNGAFFLSTPGFQAGGRWLTLFLGGIPFFVPLAATFFGLATLAKQLSKRRKKATARSSKNEPPGGAVGAILLPVLVLSVFGLMGSLVSAGVSGWAIGYTTAKFVCELFIVCLPWIALKARAEEAGEVERERVESEV